MKSYQKAPFVGPHTTEGEDIRDLRTYHSQFLFRHLYQKVWSPPLLIFSPCCLCSIDESRSFNLRELTKSVKSLPLLASSILFSRTIPFYGAQVLSIIILTLLDSIVDANC